MVGAAMLLAGGVGYSVYDYRVWRKAELGNFGHGYNDYLEPAMRLTKLYQNPVMGVRIKYPEGWKAQENDKLPFTRKGITAQSLLSGKGKVVIATWDPFLTLSMEQSKMNVNDYAEKEIAALVKSGKSLARERSFVRTEVVDWIIFTWKEEGKIRQRAVTIRNGAAIVLDARAGEGEEWNKLEKTFDEIYRSLVFI